MKNTKKKTYNVQPFNLRKELKERNMIFGFF